MNVAIALGVPGFLAYLAIVVGGFALALRRVRERREALIDKTLTAVQERLTKEINYWDWRAQELRAKEKAGHPSPRINSQRAQQRADEPFCHVVGRKSIGSGRL